MIQRSPIRKISAKRLRELGGRVPFSTIRRKPRTDKKFHDGRVRLANKSGLRLQAYERAGGRCEELKTVELSGPHYNGVVVAEIRCNRTAPWSGPLTVRGHLAHKKHGPRRDDTLKEVLWKCAECHMKEHSMY